MFDKFEVLMSWKLSWGLSFLLFGVSDGHIFFDFSNYCPYMKRFACTYIWQIYPLCSFISDWWIFTVCQICYRHCVTCHFWFNNPGKWLLTWVSDIVPYLDIAISLWKSNFEWSSSCIWFLIREYRSKKYLLSLCDIL